MAESDAVTPDGGGLHGGSGRPTAAHGQTATFLAGVGEGDAGNHGSQISVGVGGGGRSGFGSGGGGRGERSSVIGLGRRARRTSSATPAVSEAPKQVVPHPQVLMVYVSVGRSTNVLPPPLRTQGKAMCRALSCCGGCTSGGESRTTTGPCACSDGRRVHLAHGQLQGRVQAEWGDHREGAPDDEKVVRWQRL